MPATDVPLGSSNRGEAEQPQALDLLREADDKESHVKDLAQFVAPGAVSFQILWPPTVPPSHRRLDRLRLILGTNLVIGAALPLDAVVPPGDYTLQAKLAGYSLDYPSIVNVIAAQTTSVEVALQPLPAWVTFECNVSGPVHIVLEGETIGTAGVKFPLMPFETHRVTILSAGYIPTTKKLTLMSPGVTYTNRVLVNLRPKSEPR